MIRSANFSTGIRDSSGERTLGAKLGAILYGFPWTATDARGTRNRSDQAKWTSVDNPGHLVEIYGSEGWGFEFSRAC